MKTTLKRTKITIVMVLILLMLLIMAFPVTVLAAQGDYNTADILAINIFVSRVCVASWVGSWR